MKKLLLAVFAAAALLAGGCKDIKEINERLDEHEQRLSTLEEQVKEINSQVETIQALLGGKYFIKEVVELQDGSGYKLVLEDYSGAVSEKTILHGTDGSTPLMGVRQDAADGQWYWTVNGDWLLASGERVRANGSDGADGSTPVITLEDGKWYCTLDGNKTCLGDAVTEAKSLIGAIDTVSDPRNVVFTLSDGTTFTVPKAASAVKLQLLLDESLFSQVADGGTVRAEYEVVAPEGVDYTLSTYEPDGWIVLVSPSGSDKGTVTVILPQDAVSGKIMFVLNGSDGSCFVRIVQVGVRRVEKYAVDCGAGSVTVQGASSLYFIDECGWASIDGNSVALEENTEYDSRVVYLGYTDAEGESRIVEIVQAQKDAIVISENSVSVDPKGESVPFILMANVKVEASSDAEWLIVEPSTKALEQKAFTITAEANVTGAERSAAISFTSGELSQKITVTQASRTVVPTPSGVFTLVRDASDLAEGDRLLIVSASGTYAMGQQTNSNYRDAEPVRVDGDSISDFSDVIQVVTLEGTAGSWLFSVGDGKYLSAQSTSKNYLLTVSAVSDYSKWSISVSGGTAVVKASSGSKNILCFNSNSSSLRFSCYGSTSNNVEAVAIYKEEMTAYVPSEDPILDYSEPGCYLGPNNSRSYVRGSDQIIRSYDGNVLTFVLAEPETFEQVELSGFDISMAPGDAVSVALNWRRGLAKVLSGNYRMHVAKVSDGKVWLGDGRGKGFIIKK